jgi:hypothetical protein
MKTINYCIVLPEDVNMYYYAEEGTEKWYELYDIISKLLKDKVYNEEYSIIPRDICSTELYRDGDNLIFQFKSVPATAPTMSTYPYYHALIIKENHLVK